MAELMVPQVDFSSLGQLPQIYNDARDKEATRMTLASLGRDVQSGNVDYTKAAGAALAGGNSALGLQLLTLGEQQKAQARSQKASEEFQSGITKMYSPSGSPVPQQRAAAPSQPQIVPADQFNSIDAMADLKPQTQGMLPQAQGSIKGIESGGNYSAIGPVTKTGDRAYGAYQVMGANIPQWTKEVLGREMTPQEFLSNQDAQDAVFNAKFGGYSEKYGSPQSASKAWLAGEGGMNNLNARDMNGTTVSSYADQFTSSMGRPVQVASLGNLGIGGQSSPQVVPPPQVAQASPQQSDISPRVVQLIGAMSNPNLPAAQKEVAKTLLAKELESSKVPDLVKQYLFAKSEGYQGNLADFKKSGAVSVNVGDGNSKEFDKELDKKSADRFNKYIDNADAARRKMVDIDTMREISTRIGSQGAAAGVKEAIGPYAEALGLNIDGLSDIQAYTQVIQRLAPQQRAPGSGSTSDIEFKGFIKSLPGLSQNPVAREVGLNTMEALTRDDIARGDIASRLASKEITRVEAEKELRSLPDPMKTFSEWRKAHPQIYGQAVKGGTVAAPAQGQQETPPMEGARKAGDGKWYIQKDGQTFRVDP